MPKSGLAGTRIRQRRLDQGMRQGELARTCGISPSYLNLIEHNRRRIGGALLNKIAATLDTDPAMLDDGAESALAAALDAAVAALGTNQLEEMSGEALATRLPQWGRFVVAQQRRLVELERLVQSLNDRLSHDPFLSASLHNVLSTVTAIRSTSGILASGEEVEPEWQARFHRNLYEDSQRLAEGAESLVTYLDAGSDAERHDVLPQDEVEAWLAAQGWYLEALEGGTTPGEEGKDFHLDTLSSVAARSLARDYMARYAADVAALPRADLVSQMEAGTMDPGKIAIALGVELALVMRRMATLPDTHFLGGLAPGLVVCDGSGTLTFRKPVRGFEPPRYGAACPLWPLYQALQRPMMPFQTDVVLRARDEAHFVAHAISTPHYPGGFDGPSVIEATMLLVPKLHPEGVTPRAQAIGTSCRVCSEEACPARREPSILTLSSLEGTG